jgi:hypothetical protein
MRSNRRLGAGRDLRSELEVIDPDLIQSCDVKFFSRWREKMPTGR